MIDPPGGPDGRRSVVFGLTLLVFTVALAALSLGMIGKVNIFQGPWAEQDEETRLKFLASATAAALAIASALVCLAWFLRGRRSTALFRWTQVLVIAAVVLTFVSVVRTYWRPP